MFLSRELFTRWLPYLAYDEEKSLYINKDGSAGFALFLQVFHDFKLLNSISTNILNTLASFPPEFVTGFHLFYLKQIFTPVESFYFKREQLIEQNKQKRSIDKIFTKLIIDTFAGYFEKLSKDEMGRFFLILCVKDSKGDLERINEYRKVLINTLKASGCGFMEVNPEILIRILRLFLLDRRIEPLNKKKMWNENIPISTQIVWDIKNKKAIKIKPEEKEEINVEEKKFKAITLKSLNPSLFSSDNSSGLYKSAGFIYNILKYQNFCSLSSFMFSVLFQKNQQSKESKESDFFVLPVIWICDRDAERLEKTFCFFDQKIKLEAGVPQEEKYLSLPLFLLSFPFSFESFNQEILRLNRHFVLSKKKAASFVPFIPGFEDSLSPVCLFKGEYNNPVLFDPFKRGNSILLIVNRDPSGEYFKLVIAYLVFCFRTYGFSTTVFSPSYLTSSLSSMKLDSCKFTFVDIKDRVEFVEKIKEVVSYTYQKEQNEVFIFLLDNLPLSSEEENRLLPLLNSLFVISVHEEEKYFYVYDGRRDLGQKFRTGLEDSDKKNLFYKMMVFDFFHDFTKFFTRKSVSLNGWIRIHRGVRISGSSGHCIDLKNPTTEVVGEVKTTSSFSSSSPTHE